MRGENTFRGSHVKLNFASSGGSGEPMVFLHGVSRRWQDLSPLFSELQKRWSLFALDFRGHGKSGRANRYLVSDYVVDVREFIAGQFATPVVLYGHSLGAMVAVALAAEIPERVRAIVLEDPPFHTMGNRIADTSYHSLFTFMKSLAESATDVQRIAGQLAEFKIQAPDGCGLKRLGDVRDAALLRSSAECLALVDPAVFDPLIAGRWLEGFDYLDYFSRIRCPALVLQADTRRGGALQDADAEAAVALMKKCVREKIDCGHSIHWEQPATVLRLVNGFLDAL